MVLHIASPCEIEMVNAFVQCHGSPWEPPKLESTYLPATISHKTDTANGVEHTRPGRKGRIPCPQDLQSSLELVNKGSKRSGDLEGEDFAEAYMRAMHHHTPHQLSQRRYSRHYRAYSRADLPSHDSGRPQGSLAVEHPIVHAHAPADEREQPHSRIRHQRSSHPPLAFHHPISGLSVVPEPNHVTTRLAPAPPRTHVHLGGDSQPGQQTQQGRSGNERPALRISTDMAPTRDVSAVNLRYHNPLAPENIVSPARRPTHPEDLHGTRSSCQSPIDSASSPIYTALEVVSGGASQLHQWQRPHHRRTAFTNEDVHIRRQSFYDHLYNSDR